MKEAYPDDSSGDSHCPDYDLNKEEWEAMTSKRTNPEDRQYYFEEFRERIYHYLFSKEKSRGNDSEDNDYKVDDELSD